MKDSPVFINPASNLDPFLLDKELTDKIKDRLRAAGISNEDELNGAVFHFMLLSLISISSDESIDAIMVRITEYRDFIYTEFMKK